MGRERYLLGDDEDTIHANVIELKTAKEKRKNWWHYHKVYLLAATAIIALAVYSVYSITAQPQPDYSIALLTSFNLPDEIKSAMEEHFSKYADDRNNDGKAVVRLNSYVFSNASNYEAFQADFIRFAGDVEMSTCMIYLYDQASLDMLTESMSGLFQYNNGEPMPADADDYRNAMRSWDSFEGLKSCPLELEESENGWTHEKVQELCSRLNVSVRTTANTALSKKEGAPAYHADSLLLLERLESGEALR